MSVPFDRARDLVRAAEEPSWANAGTFYVPEWGYEDATHWWVIYGAREWLVDEDEDYCPMDATLLLVDKQDGTITRTTYLESMARLEAMEPVGSPPD